MERVNSMETTVERGCRNLFSEPIFHIMSPSGLMALVSIYENEDDDENDCLPAVTVPRSSVVQMEFPGGIYANRLETGTNKSQKTTSEQALPIRAANQQSPSEGNGSCERLDGRRQIW